MAESTATIEPGDAQPDAASGDDGGRAYRVSLEYFLAPLVPLMNDPSVSEVMVNGPDAVFVERKGKIEKTNVRFASERDLLAAANNVAQFVGNTIGQDRPLLDGRLPDGSRVCIVLSPIADCGTSINIRRFSRSTASPDFLIKNSAITPQAMEFLLLAVAAHQNIVVSGGTGSGKTTLLNVLSSAFHDDERVVVIEDTRELQVQKEHVVQMEARPADPYGKGQITVRDLFVTSLRMRPDRIVVGEVRRGEALDMIQAMTSGHRGSLATLHASTPADACRRLETMALLADVGLPLNALRSQVASAIDLVIQTNRMHTGRRLITHVSEVGYDDVRNTYFTHDLFNLTTDAQLLTWTGRRPHFADDLAWMGLTDRVKLTAELFAPQAPPTGKGAK
ncbi:MAG: CpaF family protein [Phycisphaera sp.]|nr:CpaF family protein [Phycisphaera sp.]